MIPIDKDILTQVTRDVCETMLGLPLSDATCQSADNRRLVAAVQISGESTLTVEVETVRDVARPFASRMFSAEPGELDEPDLRDALGEVANMIGGNVKGILCGEFDLSIPNVEERDAGNSTDLTATITIQLSYNRFPIIVRLMAV